MRTEEGEVSNDLPMAKYRLTVTVTGNTLEEVEEELGYQVRGGFLRDSDYYKRDEWTVYGGTSARVMECVNPDMTPERYRAELSEWWESRKAERRETRRVK